MEPVAVPLKYLSNAWGSLEVPLINCKVELKPKWENHCVLAAAGIDNISTNDNNIILTVKDTKLYVYVYYQQKTIKSYQNFLAKNLKYQSIGMITKQKARTKILQLSIDIFSNEIS